MAKFNIEVELDWMDEEAYSIDDELRERIVKGVENALLEKATNEAVKAVDNKIAEKILEAEEGQHREREDRHAGRRSSDRKNPGRRAWRWSRIYFTLRFMQEVSEVEHDA